MHEVVPSLLDKLEYERLFFTERLVVSSSGEVFDNQIMWQKPLKFQEIARCPFGPGDRFQSKRGQWHLARFSSSEEVEMTSDCKQELTWILQRKAKSEAQPGVLELNTATSQCRRRYH